MLSVSLYDQLFSRYKVVCWKSGKSEMHQMTPEWSWTLNSQKYPVYMKYLPPRAKYWSILLYGQPFSRYKVAENRKFRKCTEWPQTDFEILTVISTSYTLSNYPRGPNLDPFCSMASHFQDIRFTKIDKNRKCTEWSQNDLEHLTVKSTCIH